MPDPVIVMPPNRNLEPDVVAIGRRLLPPGFELRLVPAEGLADALPDADYLMGFVGPLDDATLAARPPAQARPAPERRLRPVQPGRRPGGSHTRSPSTGAPTRSRSPSTPSCS